MSGFFTQQAERLEKSFLSWKLLCLPSIWLLGAIIAWLGARTDAAIAGRQSSAEATITSDKMENHTHYGYSFSVNGHTYTGRGSTNNEYTTIGDKMIVYYDTQDPKVNLLGKDFYRNAEENRGQAIGILLMTLVAELLLFIGIRHTRRHSAARPGNLSL